MAVIWKLKKDKGKNTLASVLEILQEWRRKDLSPTSNHIFTEGVEEPIKGWRLKNFLFPIFNPV